MFQAQIGLIRKLRISAVLAGTFLFLIFGLAIFPVASSVDDTQAESRQSETTLTVSTEDLDLAFEIDAVNGSFAEASANVSVTTNNYTGYTLNIITGNTGADAGKLVGEHSSFNTISSATASADFAADAATEMNGLWGYKPSKVNGAVNTSYLPAPTELTTIEQTNAANANANTYTIGLGARADLSYEAGAYVNTFIITSVANPVGYTITYDKNTEDEVTNMPENQSGTSSDDTITLTSTVPVRGTFIFMGWCEGATTTNTLGIDTCTGSFYEAGGAYPINHTEVGTTTLKAVWDSGNRLITFDGNGADGGSMAPQQFMVGDNVVLNSNQYTRTGKVFDGWDTEADGSGVSYVDGDNYTGDSVILYAQWTEISFDKAFSDAGKNKVTVDGNQYYKMQDMNQYICEEVSADQETQLVDIRDNKTYWVLKARDNRCWMTQNLDHDIVTTTNYYTPENTDVAENWTAALATSSSYSLLSSTPLDIRSSWNPGDRYWRGPYYPPSDCIYVSMPHVSYCTYSDGTHFSGSQYSVNGMHGHVGNFYGINAAMAKNDGDDNLASICPKGWRLPTTYNNGADTVKELVYLHDMYVSGEEEQDRVYVSAPLFFVRGGILGGNIDDGSGGKYRTVMYAGAGGIYFGTNSGTTAFGSISSPGIYNQVYPVRCTARDGDELDSVNGAFAAAGKTPVEVEGKNYYKMQDMNDDICKTIRIGQEGKLIDIRDNTIYRVGRLNDGRCWMQDNLALDLTASNASTNVTSANTNADTTSLDALFNGGRVSGDSNTDNLATAGVADWTTGYNYSAPLMNRASKDLANSSDTIEAIRTSKYGIYYNYCAASAGSYCYGDGTSYGTSYDRPDTLIDAEYDICPAGWRMPTSTSSGEYQALWTAYPTADDISQINRFRTAFYAPLSGIYTNDSASYQGNRGGFWSSTWYNDSSIGNMYGLSVDSSSTLPSGSFGRSNGYSVRCIARNDNGTPITTFDDAYATAEKTKDSTSDKYKLSDMSSSICNAVTTGQNGQLVDIRDGTVYNVGKLADGRCWLLDNLALDVVSPTVQANLSPDNTNASAAAITNYKNGGNPDNNDGWTTEAVSYATNVAYYDQPNINVDSMNLVPSDSLSNNGGWKVGAYYNYCAASIGTYCYTSEQSVNRDVDQDICPAGWRLPTAGSNGEYKALYDLYPTVVDGDEQYDRFRKAFRLSLAGLFRYGSSTYRGEQNSVWSSTFSGGNYMNVLFAQTSSVSVNGRSYRLYGNSVRCIAK